MTDIVQCSFCRKEVSADSIVCLDCGNHLSKPEEDHSQTFEMKETIQAPHRWLMAAATSLLILGSLLPWGRIVSSVGTLVIRGSAGDGILTASIGGVLLLLAFLPARTSQLQRILYIAGCFISAVILVPKFNYLRTILVGAPMGTESHIGFGLILANAAAIAVIVAAIVTKPVQVKI